MKSKLTTYVQKVDGQPPRPEHPQDEEEFWVDAPPGRYQLEIKRLGKPKSHQQCKVIFGLMIEQTIIQANDLGIDLSYFLKYIVDEREPKGVGLTKDFLWQFMYLICPTTDDDGHRITLSKMTTKQAADLFERFRVIVGPLGINIENPDPEWYKKKEGQE